MKCEELLAALNEYVDGEQQSALCQALREHLAQCDPCQIVIDNIRQTITLYREGEVVPLPAALHEQLRSVLRVQWARKFPAAGGLP
jgi:predicted anti-sigma-YlaC factor YlaD